MSQDRSQGFEHSYSNTYLKEMESKFIGMRENTFYLNDKSINLARKRFFKLLVSQENEYFLFISSYNPNTIGETFRWKRVSE